MKPLVVVIFLFAAALATAQPPNFKVLEPGKVYVGGRPGLTAMSWLANHGVRTVVDLENTHVAEESAFARIYGVRFVSHPLPIFGEQNDEDVWEVLQIISSQSYQPVYFHCFLGRDRAAMVMGLYRVLYQHWTVEKAWSEMNHYHFHGDQYPGMAACFWRLARRGAPGTP